jgi:glycopeptide antibiotics resistance protein
MSESFTVLGHSIKAILSNVPWGHWVVMAVMALALMVFLLVRKKRSAYAALAMGLTVFVGLFLLETAVLMRLCGNYPYKSGVSFGFDRIIHSSVSGWAELLSNVVVFIPFGLFLSEFLASAKRFSAGRRLGLATLAGFGLSLCIECLQLLLRVGFFELTDLVMNTLGAFVGALISAGLRKVVGERRHAV